MFNRGQEYRRLDIGGNKRLLWLVKLAENQLEQEIIVP